jgi:hypothetical protein
VNVSSQLLAALNNFQFAQAEQEHAVTLGDGSAGNGKRGIQDIAHVVLGFSRHEGYPFNEFSFKHDGATVC